VRGYIYRRQRRCRRKFFNGKKWVINSWQHTYTHEGKRGTTLGPGGGEKEKSQTPSRRKTPELKKENEGKRGKCLHLDSSQERGAIQHWGEKGTSSFRAYSKNIKKKSKGSSLNQCSPRGG